MSLLQDVKALDIVRLPRVSVITSPSAQGLILGSAGHGSGMGFGTVLVRCWDQTWSLGRTGLSLSDPGLEWWKYVHLSSPFLGTTLPDTFPSPPSPQQAWLLPYLRQGGRSFRYHLAADIFPSLSRLGPYLAYDKGSVFQLSPDSWGFTSRPTLSPGHDDP